MNSDWRINMHDIVSKGISHGIYIVTVRTKDTINGMTAAWISQVSFHPLMLMVSIAPERYTHGLIKESGYFAINTLAESQKDIARHFGLKSGRKIDKFKDISYFDAQNGSLVLNNAIAFFECKLADTFKAGDHTLFVGEVVTAKLLKTNKQPLIFHWKDYF
jgi:flavin reductase (DIM6/NTAB) family NADH-FMN oxidoreductase RutF